jgi:hypothetical protein
MKGRIGAALWVNRVAATIQTCRYMGETYRRQSHLIAPQAAKYIRIKGTKLRTVLWLTGMCTVFALSTESLAGGTVTNTSIVALSLNRA